MFRNIIIFYGQELLAPHSTPRLDATPLGFRDGLFNIFATTMYIWRLFFRPHPEDVPRCGDRDQLITTGPA